MPTLFWLGNPYFSPMLSRQGWEVVSHRPRQPELLHWERICALCGRAPDVVGLGDDSTPPMLEGVERYPCLTVFYSVDSHIHSWHPAYAQAFDLCCLNLKDNMPRFVQRLRGERLRWMPLFAPVGQAPPAVPEAQKEFDLLFAGNAQPEVHPGRHAFLQELAARCPALTVTRGNFRELFPRARVVLNHAERGDLNFRVFEALGIGACLLTPRVGHGMQELFREGEELFCYDPQDMDGLLAEVDRLLASPGVRESAAARGLAAVDARHRSPHRAQEFAQWLSGFDWQALTAERLRQARRIHDGWLRVLYLHFAETLPAELKPEYLRLARQRPPAV